jgi:hypothetical protein
MLQGAEALQSGVHESPESSRVHKHQLRDIKKPIPCNLHTELRICVPAVHAGRVTDRCTEREQSPGSCYCCHVILKSPKKIFKTFRYLIRRGKIDNPGSSLFSSKFSKRTVYRTGYSGKMISYPEHII